MPFVKVKLDAREAITAPEGPYDLRVQSVKEKKTGPKSKIPGEPMLEVMILNETPGSNGENYAPVFHTIMIPSGNTEEKNVEMYKLNIQRFLAQFNIPGDESGFDTDDFAGATAKGAFLTISENEESGQTRNNLRLDRLSDEAPTGRGGRQSAKAGSAAEGPRGRRRK